MSKVVWTVKDYIILGSAFAVVVFLIIALIYRHFFL